MQRKLTTIAAVDVVGYSRLMERDEPGTLTRLKDVRANVIDPAVQRYSGRTIKLVGDGALLEFSTVVGALQCAVDVQRELATRNGSEPDGDKLQLRIGLHLGDVMVDGDDIYGDGVNVAARLESIAPPGGIVLSRQVYDHIGSNVAVRFAPLGEQSVKNISRPIEAYRVEFASPAAEVIRFDGFELDPGQFELRRDGQRVAVEPQVLNLILFLARNRGRTVTKEEIFGAIWGDRIVSDAALSSQIKAARKALGDDGAAQRFIATVHGRGFRFLAAADADAAVAAPKPDAAAADEPPPCLSQRPSVAVLPFVNQNRDADEDYFADGVSEDLITALSKHRWLSVIARNPAFAFRRSSDGLRTIGEKLRADYLVTGTVRKAGARFRITVEVVEAATEQSVWSERFDREMEDIFDLQDEISELVAARIEAELGLAEQRKAARRPRKNLGAWDLYQLGVAEFYKFTPESNLRAQHLLRESIGRDPDFAGAHSRLAYAIVLSMVYFDTPAEPALMDEALEVAKRATLLDDQDANGYFTLGRVHLARCEYDRAIEALQYALELNPCLAVTYCGLGDSLAYEGRLDEAIRQFEIAIRLSPHDPFRWAFFSYRALAHLFRGEFEDAALWSRNAIRIPNAQFWAWAHLVAALGHSGGEAGAQAALKDLLERKPDFSIRFARERLFYVKRPEQLELYLDGLRRAGVREE